MAITIRDKMNEVKDALKAEGRKFKGIVFSTNDDDLAGVNDQLIQVVAEGVAEFNQENPAIAKISMTEREKFETDTVVERECPICGHQVNALFHKCDNTLLEVILDLPPSAGALKPQIFCSAAEVAIAAITSIDVNTAGTDASNIAWHVGQTLYADGIGNVVQKLGTIISFVQYGERRRYTFASFTTTAIIAAGAKIWVDTQRQIRYLIEASRIVDWSGALKPVARDPATPYKHHKANWSLGDKLIADFRDGLWPGRYSFEEWDKHGGQKCEENARRADYRSADWFFGPLKSNFIGELSRVSVKLVKWTSCDKFHSRSWYQGNVLKDIFLPAPSHCPTPLMCLYNQGALGLDLSFVTHIFLLEPIQDAGLLEQIISRAHRIGCKGPVHVITLLVWQTGMNHSIQQQISKICDHCYKSFNNGTSADDHMKVCHRNPVNVDQVPRFTLRKIFQEIKPPVVVVPKQ